MSADRRLRAGLVAGAVCLAAVAGVLACFAWREPATPWMLDARQALGSDGVTCAFDLAAPATIELTLDCPVEAAGGVYRLLPAKTPSLVFVPAPAPPVPVQVAAGEEARLRLVLEHAGAYVLHLEPAPMAMGTMVPQVRARIRAVAAD
jgi:hypothetical protein